MTWEIRHGDVLHHLALIRSGSVHCVVTSPPYWGLRDYKTRGQLGLEPTPEEYVAKMVAVFREVRRVLRMDGTLWCNMGDGYASHPGGNADGRASGSTLEGAKREIVPPSLGLGGLKPKDLVGMPWRLAFALQAHGWWLRSDVIWHKPNPMPESVTDRPAKAHEYVFLLSKSARYYYDIEAVREPASYAGRLLDYTGEQKANTANPDLQRTLPRGRVIEVASGRNLRTVWTIPTEPFPEAHFATFPRRLVLPCVQAGTSAKGCCVNCGAPWERVVDVAYRNDTTIDGRPAKGNHRPEREGESMTFASGERTRRIASTTGWRPTCYQANGKPHDCIPLWDPVPCTVLDPFCGSGTVGVVATQLGRHFVGIELNADYCAMAERRIRNPEPEALMEVGDGQLGLFEVPS